jgi:hypothetical protein
MHFVRPQSDQLRGRAPHDSKRNRHAGGGAELCRDHFEVLLIVHTIRPGPSRVVESRESKGLVYKHEVDRGMCGSRQRCGSADRLLGERRAV